MSASMNREEGSNRWEVNTYYLSLPGNTVEHYAVELEYIKIFCMFEQNNS